MGRKKKCGKKTSEMRGNEKKLQWSEQISSLCKYLKEKIENNELCRNTNEIMNVEFFVHT